MADGVNVDDETNIHGDNDARAGIVYILKVDNGDLN